jgi:hypothetical protein
VVGAVVGLAIVAVLSWLALRRRRRILSARQASGSHEKSQLHSEDIRPDRKELEGTLGSGDMLERKPTEFAEMPANEEVIQDNLKEMPSNEPACQEMETTENEMAALDRLARSAQSTTLVGDKTTSDNSER